LKKNLQRTVIEIFDVVQVLDATLLPLLSSCRQFVHANWRERLHRSLRRNSPASPASTPQSDCQALDSQPSPSPRPLTAAPPPASLAQVCALAARAAAAKASAAASDLSLSPASASVSAMHQMRACSSDNQLTRGQKWKAGRFHRLSQGRARARRRKGMKGVASSI